MGHSFGINITGGNNMNQFGDNNTANQTINQQGAVTTLEDVEKAIQEEVPEEERDMLIDALVRTRELEAQLQEQEEIKPEQQSALDEIFNKFGKYEKVAKVAAAALKTLPGIGAFAKAGIAALEEATKT